MTTAIEYREDAKRHFSAAIESFERCDTDGFVSQHCSDLNGRLANARAKIVEDGHRAVFVGLYEGERRVLAKLIDTKFGRAWLLDESETGLIARRGKKFLPHGARSRVLKDLGLNEAKELAPAWASFGGSGYGFSGLGSVTIDIYRTGDTFGADAERI